MIAALLAQGYDPLLATVFATYLHGLAGNIVSQSNSFEAVMAGDVADHIGKAYLSLLEPDPPVQQDENDQK
jgi:NAD(P)H-hydrate repair Nnr-like enzyme with NAD(P)H-hydrate dehydratase domain